MVATIAAGMTNGTSRRYSRNRFTVRHKRKSVVAPPLPAGQYFRLLFFHASTLPVTAFPVVLEVAGSTKSSLASFGNRRQMLQAALQMQRRELPRRCQQA